MKFCVVLSVTKAYRTVSPQPSGSIDDLIAEFSSRQPVRAKSVIVSLMGDAVAHHSGAIWLGQLIDILNRLGMNERLVRTAVYRLVQDDWLEAVRRGRRSLYRFSSAGLSRFENAAQRVYQTEALEWDGMWTIVSPVMVKDKDRETLKRELSWLGFGQIAPGMLAHPTGTRKALDRTLKTLGMTDQVLVLSASAEDPGSTALLKSLSQQAWDTPDLRQRYDQFISTFGPLENGLNSASMPTDEHCFYLRLLAVHEYRRILLKDSDLPSQLLGERWPGQESADLLKSIYLKTSVAAERFIAQNLHVEDTSGDRAAFARRFGGALGAPAERLAG